MQIIIKKKIKKSVNKTILNRLTIVDHHDLSIFKRKMFDNKKPFFQNF